MNASKYQPANCPRCGVPYVKLPAHDLRRRSRDHILPLSRGGRFAVMWGDVNNIEIMCAGCNGFRGACGNCWGAVACVDAVARDSGQNRGQIFRRWKLGLQTEIIKSADAAIKPRVRSVSPPHISVPESEDAMARQERSRLAVQLGMAVHKIGPPEFIFPADTAAKRVWNLATLRMGAYHGPVPVDCK